MFAFLDEGSSGTLIEQNLAEQLEIKGPNMPLCLTWTANMTRAENKSQLVSLEVSGLGRQKRYRLENARTVECLNLPTQTLRFSELQDKFRHLVGLPVSSYENAMPQLLLGLGDLTLAIPRKIKEINGGPIAAKTKLGWCISVAQTQFSSTITIFASAKMKANWMT